MTHPRVYCGAVSAYVRTFRPPALPVFFRILAPLPLEVVFPSIRYVLQLQSCPAASRHELVAEDPLRGRWVIIGPSYRGAEFLEAAVYQVGVPVAVASIDGAILTRLARDGHAVRVPGPADDLTARWPVERSLLGAWLPADQRVAVGHLAKMEGAIRPGGIINDHTILPQHALPPTQ